MAGPRASARELKANIVVIGGRVGGCAASLAALRGGHRVILTEETDWIGGQLTQQAVPPDEHPWIEQFGCTRSYRRYRRLVRSFYRRSYQLSATSLQAPHFNPGNCSVSRLCHEPLAGLAALEEMLAPFVSNGRLTILRRHKAISATVDGDRVESVRVRDLDRSSETEIAAPFFIDATELGDLLPLTGTEGRLGRLAVEDLEFGETALAGRVRTPADYCGWDHLRGRGTRAGSAR